MKLLPETLQRLAHMARLQVEPQDLEGLRKDLEAILDHAENLPALEPRGDTQTPLSWSRDDRPEPAGDGGLVDLAPESRGGYYVVPRTVDKHGS